VQREVIMADFTLSGEMVTLCIGVLGAAGIVIQRAIKLGGAASRIEMKVDIILEEQGSAKRSRAKLHDKVSGLETWRDVHKAEHSVQTPHSTQAVQ